MPQKKYVSLNRLETFLTELKSKFVKIEDYVVDSSLSSTSANPVQNKVVDAEFEAVSTAMNALELAIDNVNDKLSDISSINVYTKDEIDNMEFITVDDIDAICGVTIQVASLNNEVMF